MTDKKMMIELLNRLGYERTDIWADFKEFVIEDDEICVGFSCCESCFESPTHFYFNKDGKIV